MEVAKELWYGRTCTSVDYSGPCRQLPVWSAAEPGSTAVDAIMDVS